MSLTPGALTYAADSYQKDSVGYIGALKTASVKDDLTLSRVLPKPTSVFSGVLRTRFKLVRTYNLTGALTPTGDVIVEGNISVPVGMAAGDVATVKGVLADFCGEADVLTLIRDGKITY